MIGRKRAIEKHCYDTNYQVPAEVSHVVRDEIACTFSSADSQSTGCSSSCLASFSAKKKITSKHTVMYTTEAE